MIAMRKSDVGFKKPRMELKNALFAKSVSVSLPLCRGGDPQKSGSNYSAQSLTSAWEGG